MSEHIEVTTAGAVRHIRFDRPEKRNALTQEMYAAAAAALREADADQAIGAVLLSGEGAAFCAGNDLADFLAHPDLGEDAPVVSFLEALLEIDVPLVAAVHGHAVGVGATMLLHCDVVVADETAILSFPFASLGVVPEAASSVLLAQVAGPRVAARALLVGERFGAAESLAAGLVSQVVAAGEHVAVATAAAERIAAQPRTAVRIAKRLLHEPFQPPAERMRREVALFAEQLASPEFRERARQFLR